MTKKRAPRRRFKVNDATCTIEEGVAGVYQDIGELAQEMREWADNLEEKFSNTDKYQRVNDAADTLENYIDEDVVPEWLSHEIVVKYTFISKRRLSRADRCSNACTLAQAIIDKLEEGILWLDADKAEELVTLRDNLQQLIDDCQGVEFPGRYG